MLSGWTILSQKTRITLSKGNYSKSNDEIPFFKDYLLKEACKKLSCRGYLCR